MLQSFALFLAFCQLIFKRLTSRPMLTLLALLGVVLAVGLVSSAAFFSQAVDRVILGQELRALSAETGRLPFSTRVYFLPSARKAVSVVQAEQLGEHVAATFSSEIGLPIAHQGLQIESSGLMLLPGPNDTRYSTDSPLKTDVELVYIADVTPYLTWVAGEPLADLPPSAPNTLDVWMHTQLAAELGAGVGETFQVLVNRRFAPQPVYIRGLWETTDPTDPFWFSNPDLTLRSGLLVTRQGYIAYAESLLPAKAGLVHWHILLDEDALNPAHAARYVEGFGRGMSIIDQYLPGARLDVSPLDPLQQFVQRQATLTLMLLGFNLPALAFLLYFLILIALIIAGWQRRETALLVSRGMSIRTVLGLTAFEQCLLFVVGLPLGLAFGMGLARWMGYTVSFLSFRAGPPLPVSLQGINWPLVAAALGVTLLARLLPMIPAARQSVAQQAREGARPLRPPFWQRTYLDLLLILPTYYAFDQLTKQGTLALRAGEPPDQLFQDPLLILVPALFVLTAALLAMRIFPWFMRLLDLLARYTPWLTLHLALRQLGRNSQGYLNPLLLIIIALGMGIYTRALAASLDQWLTDQVYYRIGADVTFVPAPPLSVEESEPPPDGVFIPPKDEFRDLPGVQAVTRMGDYRVSFKTPDGEERGRFLAVDRVDFPTVAWFRRDFARESLGGLMNRLAASPDAILVTPAFLAAHQLNVGDQIELRVSLTRYYSWIGLWRIAGVYDYFPTVEPGELTIIGNLEHLFTEAGSEFPHAIWLRVTPEADRMVLFSEVERKGLEVTKPLDAADTLRTEQGKMERVGIFGVLTVGFLAASLMAILALLVHSYASLQERLYQFGVMRAIGLMHRQVIGQVALEYASLTLYGAMSGAGIGLLTAQVFAPFFRIPDVAGAPPPPLLPIIQESTSLQLALAFAAAMIVAELLIVLRALTTRLFDALRMGHQG
jgi:putative ABC transport system permease protein